MANPKCVLCDRVYNKYSKGGNYGWHVDENGNIERCAYQVLNMQVRFVNDVEEAPKILKIRSIQ